MARPAGGGGLSRIVSRRGYRERMGMNGFALFSLFSSAVCLFLGNFIFYQDRRSPLNRIFALFCISIAYLAFTEFEYRQADAFETARFWVRTSSLWPLSMSLLLHFVLLITAAPVRRTGLLAIYAPAAGVALVELFTNRLTTAPVRAPWGWTYGVPDMSVFVFAVVMWTIGIGIACLALCLRSLVRESDWTKKQQMKFILIGLCAPLVVGVVSEALPMFSSLRLPELTLTFLGLNSVFIGYAIWKYRLFRLTPAAVAHTVSSGILDCLILADRSGTIVFANPAALKLLGYQEEGLEGAPVGDLLRGSTAGASPTEHRTGAAIETVFHARDGAEIPIALSVFPVDKNETVAGTVYIASDLTERRKGEQLSSLLHEKEALLMEIHHRVKNNLQVISSLANLQQSHYDQDASTRLALDTIKNRIRCIALVHEKLYRSHDLAHINFADYVRDLTGELIRSHRKAQDDITYDIDADDFSMEIDIAVPCGLIINELVSNSLKHAFVERTGGAIAVELHSDSRHQFDLTIRDNGIGIPKEIDPATTETLGLQLVAMLARQIGALVHVDADHGTAVRISKPHPSP